MMYEIKRCVGTETEGFASCWRAVEKFFSAFDRLSAAELLEWEEDYYLELMPDRTMDVLYDQWCEEEAFLLCWGETKNTLIPRGEGEWVVKMPNNGRGHDYCDDEVLYWSSADQEGLGKYFAETLCIGEVVMRFENSCKREDTFVVPLYAQRRLTWDEEGEKKTSSYTRSDDAVSSGVYDDAEYCGTDGGLVDSWIAICGLSTAERILSFIVQNDLNDIHESNWAWREGVPCVYDFSGYHES